MTTEDPRVALFPVAYVLTDGESESTHQSVEAAVNNALMLDGASQVLIRGKHQTLLAANVAARGTK